MPGCTATAITPSRATSSSEPQAPLAGNVTPSWLDFRRRWFDRWLKGIDNGVDREPRRAPVPDGRRQRARRPRRAGSIMAGAGSRRRAGRLPGRRVPTLLSPRRRAAFRRRRRMRDAEPLSYDFDPSDPVPTIGGALTSGQPVFEGGGFDQREARAVLRLPQPGPAAVGAARRARRSRPSRSQRTSPSIGPDRGGALGLVRCAATRISPLS